MSESSPQIVTKPADKNGSLLQSFPGLTKPLTYVCCGARGELNYHLADMIPGSRFVGFEPDEKECANLCQQAKAGYTYFPVALGGTTCVRTFYITQDPACSSLLPPDGMFFGRFLDGAPKIEIKEMRQVKVVTLDSYLPASGIGYVDFMHLDTQGSELEILKGAEELLTQSVLGLQIEVSFSPIYKDQPLFADIDTHVRRFGFVLFDVLHNRCRGQNYPGNLSTRGRLLWGDAVYLKDYNAITGPGWKEADKRLAVIAFLQGFYDYSLEIIDFLLQKAQEECDLDEVTSLNRLKRQCLSSLAGAHRWIWLRKWVKRYGFGRLTHWMRQRLGLTLLETYVAPCFNRRGRSACG